MTLCIIALPQDAFAESFAAFCLQQNVKHVLLTPSAASQLFTILIDGNKTTVLPNYSVFVRSVRDTNLQCTSDETFLQGESAAMLWSALSLSHAPVINRPTNDGFFAKLAETPSINEHRAKLPPRSEIFVGSLKNFKYVDYQHVWWVAGDDEHPPRTLQKPFVGDVPCRLRPGVDKPGYEQVVIVGANAWRLSDAKLDDLFLEKKSIDAAHHLNLVFATITWLVDAEAQNAYPVVIDSQPQLPLNSKFILPIQRALLGALTP